MWFPAKVYFVMKQWFSQPPHVSLREVWEAEASRLSRLAAGFFFAAGTGVQCASVGPHQFRHVAARYFRTGEQFQRPYDRIVAHGTSLHHYPVAQFFAFLQFQNLVEAVLDHRIGEPGCDIGHRSPFAEYLFHFGVHEDRTARAQVARPLGEACLRREIGDRIPQRVGECLDEGAAAR